MSEFAGRPGTAVGRFVIEDKLGEGGMGIVFAAHDPELDRRVAIKLLRPSTGSAQATLDRSSRLQREAQAMARLSHPNVVSVYDVGVDGEQIFIAMELVDGSSLRQWQGQAQRSWREILAVYLQAGRGLEAGHEVGLVHLDFKPDNVLVSQDGLARVADFGLARSVEPPAAVDSEDGPSTAAGTPRYMAPEQWRGRRADARTDQFAFCVALWEALYREHPFDLATRQPAGDDTLTDSQIANLPVHSRCLDEYWCRSLLGHRRAPPRGSPVPAQVGRVLARGLASDPDARHPDTGALLDQLAAVLRPRRGRWLAISAVAVAGAAAGTGWFAGHGAAPADPCAAATVAIEAVWGGAQERDLTRALGASGRADAADTARRTLERLGRYRDAWRAMRRDTCAATRVQGTQSPALLDLRMQCLDRRLGELDALVHALSTTSVTALDHAVQASQELTPIDACANTAELVAVQPMPPGAPARQAILATEARLDAIQALSRTGAYQEALASVPALVDQARHQGYTPTLARALELQGWLLRQTGDAAAAELVTREAIRNAAEAHAGTVEAEAWTNLVHVLGQMRGRPGDAAILRPAAEAAVARTGNPSLRARLALALTLLLRTQGTYGDAEALGTAELARAEAALGADDLDVAAIRGALASAQWSLGKIDEAITSTREVRAVQERVLGASHPAVGKTLVLLGGLLNDRGRYREARGELERAVRILELALGRDHTEVATALNNLAGAISGDGDSEAARRIHERVLAIREKAFGPDSEPVALALNNLGQMLIEVNRGAEAEPLLRRSVAIREQRFGPDHAKVASSLTNLAWALDTTGRCAQAVPLYDRAIAIDERAFGRDHARVASPLSGRGLCLVDRDPAGAAVALERAARLVSDGSDPGLLAMTRFGLARALRKLGRDAARARELAEQARAYAVEHYDREMTSRIAAWLRER